MWHLAGVNQNMHYDTSNYISLATKGTMHSIGCFVNRGKAGDALGVGLVMLIGVPIPRDFT
jgi:hypothetical protein